MTDQQHGPDLPAREPITLQQLRGTEARLDHESIWDRTIRFWHYYFAAVVGIGLLNLVALGLDTRGDVLGFAALLLIIAGYLIFGARTVGRSMGAGAWVYLGVLVIGTFGLTFFWEDNGSFILFLAFAQVWVVSDSFVRGAAAALGVGLAGFLGFWSAGGWAAEQVSGPAITMLVSAVFSLAMGAWITLIIQQSSERAELIRHLQATRDALADAHRSEGVLAERDRLARDIHDTLAQGFISVITQTQAAAARLEKSAADPNVVQALTRLTVIEQTARENLAEARALVASSEPTTLARGSLPAALQHLAARHQEESGMPTSTRIEPTGTGIDLGTEVMLLRVAQESLANVRRHARARTAGLELTGSDGEVVLVVRDDGQGFDPISQAGFGINGMTSRIAEAGGVLTVRSNPGHGTTITARVPV